MVRSIIERIPGLDAAQQALDTVFPLREDHSGIYHKLAGLWIAAGAYATEETVEWAEKSISHADPISFLGTIAVAAAPTAGAAFMWRRGWRARGE